MKLCVPAMDKQGLKSAVSPHFGSAPYFIIVDTESGAVDEVPNHNQHHSHGLCHPWALLQGRGIGSLVCSGIGAGALGRMRQAGIRVFRAEGGTVGELVENYKNGRLKEMAPDGACVRHGCH